MIPEAEFRVVDGMPMVRLPDPGVCNDGTHAMFLDREELESLLAEMNRRWPQAKVATVTREDGWHRAGLSSVPDPELLRSVQGDESESNWSRRMRR